MHSFEPYLRRTWRLQVKVPLGRARNAPFSLGQIKRAVMAVRGQRLGLDDSRMIRVRIRLAAQIFCICAITACNKIYAKN